MGLRIGSEVWLTVDRISNNGNGVVEIDDSSHLNIGPIRHSVVGDKIKVKITGDQSGKPVDPDVRKDVYASPSDEQSNGVQVGETLSGTIWKKDREGNTILQQEGTRIRVPGASLGDEVTVRISEIKGHEGDWLVVVGEHLDSSSEPINRREELVQKLASRELEQEPTTCPCPVQSCDYSGPLASVVGHVSGKNEDLHDWQRLGYSGANDYKQQHSGSRSSSTGTTTLLHLTDTHLGKDEHGFGKNKWPVDCEEGFQDAVDFALDREVDAVLHTGDLFHTGHSEIPVELEGLVRQELTRLKDVDIPFIYIRGNHEREAGKHLLERFQTEGLAKSVTEAGTRVGTDLVVRGRDYQPASWWKNGKWSPSSKASNRFTLGAFHQSVTPIRNADKAECSVSDFGGQAGSLENYFDAIALGHLHTTLFTRHGDVPVICGGATAKLGKTENSLSPVIGLFEATRSELEYTRYAL